MKITKEKVVHSHSPGVPSCFWVTMPTLPVLEITSVVYLAGNPLWSGSQWSPNKQSQSSPWRQCRICSETPDTIYPSSSKKIRLSKFKTKKKKLLWKNYERALYFHYLGPEQMKGVETEAFQWVKGIWVNLMRTIWTRQWVSTEVLMKWGPVSSNQYRGETLGTESQKIKARNDLYRL